MTDSQAVATRDAQAPARNGGTPQSVLEVFSSESFKRQVAAALPAHSSADSMMRIALTEVRMNPDLQKCTVPSFMGALLKAAQAGLRPGMFGEGFLIPLEAARDQRLRVGVRILHTFITRHAIPFLTV